MSQSDEDAEPEYSEGMDDEPRVPEGVLKGIEDIAEDNTASKEEIEAVLDF